MSYTFGGLTQPSPNANTWTTAVTGVPQGATIITNFVWNNPGGDTITSIGDDNGGSYSPVGTRGTSGGNGWNDCWYAPNCNSGTHNLSIAFSAQEEGYMATFWVNGVGSPTGTASIVYNNFPGTGSNILVSNNITTTVNGALILGLFCGADDSSGTFSAGTSPNAFTSLGGSVPAQEFFVQTTAATITATAGATINAASWAWILAFAPAAAPTGIPIAWLQ